MQVLSPRRPPDQVGFWLLLYCPETGAYAAIGLLEWLKEAPDGWVAADDELYTSKEDALLASLLLAY